MSRQQLVFHLGCPQKLSRSFLRYLTKIEVSGGITSHFHSNSPTLTTLVTTIYLLGYTFGPLAIAPLSELYGRAILYIICIALFLVFTTAPSLPSLIVFRLLAGIAGSCPVTLGTASIADMIPPHKLGGAMAAYIVGAVLGPSLGPIAGGYLAPAEGLGWRWTFWVMVIITAPRRSLNSSSSSCLRLTSRFTTALSTAVTSDLGSTLFALSAISWQSVTPSTLPT